MLIQRRKTTAERFAEEHHAKTRAVARMVNADKASPLFDLDDRLNLNGFSTQFLTTTSHGPDRLAYDQFKRWTYVAISAIARRLMGYEWVAGDIVKAKKPNPKRQKGWRDPVDGESFQRRQLSLTEIQSLPSGLRSKLGGSMKVPAKEVEVLDEHDVLDLLARPNHVQKKSEFLFCLVANLYLTGESWIIGGKDSAGDTTMWAVPSTWVDVEHKETLFSGFRLRADGYVGNIEIPPEAITRVYFPDPSDLKKVTSPVMANWEAIKTDESLQKAHKASFDQGIFPKIAIGIGRNIDHTGKQLATRPVLNGEQREQLMSAIQSVWMDSAADGLPAILDGLIEEVTVLQSTPLEMDYMNSSKMIKDRIFQAFGLNPIIVGEITASNKAQALVAERSFMRNVLQPLADSISMTMTDYLGPWYDKPKRLAVWLEKDLPKDEDLTVKKWQFGVDKGLVSDEEFRREMFGLEPLETDENLATRGKLLDNPQAMAGLTAMIGSINSGAMDYDAAVIQVTHFFEVPADIAQAMLGPKPTPADIDANQPPPAEPIDDGASNDAEDDETDDTPQSDEPDDEEMDGSEVEADDDGKAKKKSLIRKLTRPMVKSTLAEMQEKRIAKAIPKFDGFFRSIISEVITELAKLSHVPPSIDAVFPTDLKEKFIDIASRPLIEGIIYGAMVEIELFDRIQADKHREAKLTTATQVLQLLGVTDIGDWFSFEVPKWLSDAAMTQVANSFDQPYWAGVIDTTRNDLTKVFDRGITQGLSIREMSSQIMSTMGADYSRMRATRVARTEMTDAMNFGHTEGIKQLNKDVPEIEMGKEWLSVFAGTSRSAHMANDGVTVPVEGSFTLNGVSCNHPGDQSLPAGDRCNCMCTILSSFITEEMNIREDEAQDKDQSTSLVDMAKRVGFTPQNTSGADTFDMYKLIDDPKTTRVKGNFTEERSKLHEKILTAMMKGSTKQEKPIYTFMGGGSASGKGSILKQNKVKLRKGTVHIDADEIKNDIPEYVGYQKEGDFRAASFAHEESSLLSKDASAMAIEGQRDVLLDSTGDSGYPKFKAKVEAAKKGGHKTVGHYVTVDTEEAIRRSTLRAARTGREVPIPAIKQIHQSVTDVFVRAVDENLFDELTLWDNHGKVPIKIFEMKNGKKKIFNEKLYKAFLRKGSNPPPLPEILKEIADHKELDAIHKKVVDLKWETKWADEVKALQAERETVRIKRDKLLASKNSWDQQTSDMTRKVADLDNSIRDKTWELAQERNLNRQRLIDAIAVEKDQRAKFQIEFAENMGHDRPSDALETISKTYKKKTKEAINFTEKFADKAVVGDATDTRWFEGKRGLRAYQRETFNHGPSSGMYIPMTDDVDTFVHELCHSIEARNPELNAKTNKFLSARINEAGTDKVKLNKLYKSHGYSSTEFGNEDSFGQLFDEPGSSSKHYIGKRYDNGQTEILTMGFEEFYRDAKSFAQKDPEFFKFIVGILRGSL